MMIRAKVMMRERSVQCVKKHRDEYTQIFFEKALALE